MIPAKLRNAIGASTLVVTKGIEQCLWLFTPEMWKRISDNLMESTSLFDPKARMIRRALISPAVEVEFDKSGRINLSPALREAAGLEKDCIVLGIEAYLEIWDVSVYRQYLEGVQSEYKEAAKDLSKLLSI